MRRAYCFSWRNLGAAILMKKKILQFCTFDSVYNTNLQKQLNNDSDFASEYSLVSLTLESLIEAFLKNQGISEYSSLNKLKKLLFWKKFCRYLNIAYPFDPQKDIVNIQFVDFKYIWLIGYLKKNFSRIILSFWGSDLLRQSNRRLKAMNKLFKVSDVITFETEEMEHIFEKKTNRNYKSKYSLVKFGLSELDEIDGLSNDDIHRFCHKYKIDSCKKTVVVGYNRIFQQQHLPVIQSLIKYNVSSEDIFIIVPWTYGNHDPEYRRRLEDCIKGKYNYCFLNDHLDEKEIACLRKITDIFVQVQMTDSLSASMLETLYAKNMVITGRWLPYEELIDKGIKMAYVDSPELVGEEVRRLIECSQNEEERLRNKLIVHDMSSWDTNLEKWKSLYRV